MPADRTEVARRGQDAFNARDVDRLIELSHPDCEWLPFRAQLEGRTYRGHEGVRRFVSDMDEDWDEFRIELSEITEVGERVLLVGDLKARSSSGLTIDNPAGFVMEFRDGKIWRLTSYSDPGEARRAAGSS